MATTVPRDRPDRTLLLPYGSPAGRRPGRTGIQMTAPLLPLAAVFTGRRFAQRPAPGTLRQVCACKSVSEMKDPLALVTAGTGWINKHWRTGRPFPESPLTWRRVVPQGLLRAPGRAASRPSRAVTSGQGPPPLAVRTRRALRELAGLCTRRPWQLPPSRVALGSLCSSFDP
jgi:hypothetical protein